MTKKSLLIKKNLIEQKISYSPYKDYEIKLSQCEVILIAEATIKYMDYLKQIEKDTTVIFSEKRKGYDLLLPKIKMLTEQFINDYEGLQKKLNTIEMQLADINKRK